MVESPAQFGRLKTLIHLGPVSGVHVTSAAQHLRILVNQNHPQLSVWLQSELLAAEYA